MRINREKIKGVAICKKDIQINNQSNRKRKNRSERRGEKWNNNVDINKFKMGTTTQKKFKNQIYFKRILIRAYL